MDTPLRKKTASLDAALDALQFGAATPDAPEPLSFEQLAVVLTLIMAKLGPACCGELCDVLGLVRDNMDATTTPIAVMLRHAAMRGVDVNDAILQALHSAVDRFTETNVATHPHAAKIVRREPPAADAPSAASARVVDPPRSMGPRIVAHLPSFPPVTGALLRDATDARSSRPSLVDSAAERPTAASESGPAAVSSDGVFGKWYVGVVLKLPEPPKIVNAAVVAEATKTDPVKHFLARMRSALCPDWHSPERLAHWSLTKSDTMRLIVVDAVLSVCAEAGRGAMPHDPLIDLYSRFAPRAGEFRSELVRQMEFDARKAEAEIESALQSAGLLYSHIMYESSRARRGARPIVASRLQRANHGRTSTYALVLQTPDANARHLFELSGGKTTAVYCLAACMIAFPSMFPSAIANDSTSNEAVLFARCMVRAFRHAALLQLERIDKSGDSRRKEPAAPVATSSPARTPAAPPPMPSGSDLLDAVRRAIVPGRLSDRQQAARDTRKRPMARLVDRLAAARHNEWYLKERHVYWSMSKTVLPKLMVVDATMLSTDAQQRRAFLELTCHELYAACRPSKDAFEHALCARMGLARIAMRTELEKRLFAVGLMQKFVPNDEYAWSSRPIVMARMRNPTTTDAITRGCFLLQDAPGHVVHLGRNKGKRVPDGAYLLAAALTVLPRAAAINDRPLMDVVVLLREAFADAVRAKAAATGDETDGGSVSDGGDDDDDADDTSSDDSDADTGKEAIVDNSQPAPASPTLEPDARMQETDKLQRSYPSSPSPTSTQSATPAVPSDDVASICAFLTLVATERRPGRREHAKGRFHVTAEYAGERITVHSLYADGQDALEEVMFAIRSNRLLRVSVVFVTTSFSRAAFASACSASHIHA